jgi:alkanesulfonate monooxygenase SsuD/methylene tetrahydromethanopterin reductase-like flavin-dependent oxidoreductase (luciferase family)
MRATINRQAKAMKAMPPLLGPPVFTISLVGSAKAGRRFGFEYECEMMTEGERRAAVDPRVARMKRDVRVMMSFMVVLNIL